MIDRKFGGTKENLTHLNLMSKILKTTCTHMLTALKALLKEAIQQTIQPDLSAHHPKQVCSETQTTVNFYPPMPSIANIVLLLPWLQSASQYQKLLPLRLKASLAQCFILVDMVEGRILWDVTPSDYPKEDRWPIFEAQVKTIAQLHSLDYEAIGLGDYGAGNYLNAKSDAGLNNILPLKLRKSTIWISSWRGCRGKFRRMTRPRSHGDFRLDNMVCIH